MKFSKVLQLAALVSSAAAAKHPKSASRNINGNVGGLLRSTNKVTSSKRMECDLEYEEECYSDEGEVIVCGDFESGGCVCPEGLTRCPSAGNGESWTDCTAGVCCDYDTQETCFDESGNKSCIDIADGGCPCPEGEAKCDADFANGEPGFCFPKDFCCDLETEEECAETETCAKIADGGCPCPPGTERCNADLPTDAGYCAPPEFCCDETEEECFDTETCAKIDEGGCKCPRGTEKCNADPDNLDSGYCAPKDFCCDPVTEEECWDTETCAKIADGGCPCPEGSTRCELENGALDYCSDTGVCCTSEEWECEDEAGDFVCSATECQTNGEDYDAPKYLVVEMIQTKGTPEELSYFQHLQVSQEQLLVTNEKKVVNSAKLLMGLKKKEIELFRTIKRREAKSDFKESEVSFMKLWRS